MSNKLGLPSFANALSVASVLGRDAFLSVSPEHAELYSLCDYASIIARFTRDTIITDSGEEFVTTIPQTKVNAVKALLDANEEADVFVEVDKIIIKTSSSTRKIALAVCTQEIPQLRHEEISLKVESPSLFLESVQKALKFADQLDDRPTGYIHVEDGLVYGLSYHSSIISFCQFPINVRISRDQVKLIQTLMKYERVFVSESEDQSSWVIEVANANGKPVVTCKISKPSIPEFHIKSSVVGVKVVDGNFNVINRDLIFRTDFHALSKVVGESASVFGAKDEQAVRLKLLNGKMSVLSSSTTAGVDTYKAEVDCTGHDFDKTLSPILVNKALSNVDTIVVAWNDVNENSPIHFIGKKSIALVSRTLIKVEE